MGHLQATEMAHYADRKTALSWHLQSNHFPPHPAFMIPVCEAAIKAVEEDPLLGDYGSGVWSERIDLPGNVTFRDRTYATVGEIVEGFHLDGFLPDAQSVYDDEDADE